MSGSETGLLTSREPFSIGLQKGPVASQPMLQNMRMPFAAADGTGVYKPIAATSPSYQSSAGAGAGGGGGAVVAGDGSAGGGIVSPGGGGGGGGGGSGLNMNNMGSGGETMKRKRGRPRKYGPDGTMALPLSPPPPSVVVNQSGGGGFSSPHTAAAAAPPSDGGSAGGPGSPLSMKKARGRPPGSTKKQQSETMGSAGFGFTPHVITVKAGEDVSSKIMSFSQHGPRAVCILSANGAISNVTLRQPATSGGTVTYEGRFEILSLSGSFLLSENGGQRSRTGGLSVSLSGPDGRVLGGGVAGLLMAASPVQVVVGSFVSDGRKESKSANRVEPMSVSQNLGAGGGPTGPGSPASRGTLSESSGGPGSPLNHSTGACNNNNNNNQPLGMSSMPWK